MILSQEPLILLMTPNAYSDELSSLGKLIIYFSLEFPVGGHLTSFTPLPPCEDMCLNGEHAQTCMLPSVSLLVSTGKCLSLWSYCSGVC